MEDQLLFNPEIKITTLRNNNKTIKRKQLVKKKEQQKGTSVLTTCTIPKEVMFDHGYKVNEANNANKN